MAELKHAIDCDIHPAIESATDLLPYLPHYWQEAITSRGIGRLDTPLFNPNVPFNGRPDWRPAKGSPGSNIDMVGTQALDQFSAEIGICNLLFGGQFVTNPYFAAALCTAMNDWMVAQCFEKDARLRGSIVVPMHNIEAAVAEVERRASDKRFVQVLLFVGSHVSLGQRHYWPLYEAAEKHGLAIGIHAGSSGRNPPTQTGWGSYRAEDYVLQSGIFETQLMSLVVEGVFQRCPNLKVCLIESGVTWMPVFLWRFSKLWRGTRFETPWIETSPEKIVRDHVFCTVQPLDTPLGESGHFERICEEVQSEDMWLYASDYPHWHFDDDDVLPDIGSSALKAKVLYENAQRAYPRLQVTGG